MSNILCAALFFLGLTSTVFAFECYECLTYLQPECGHLPDSFEVNVVNCTGYCFKLIYDPPEGILEVVRGCTENKDDPPDVCKISRNTIPVLPDGAECHLCESDRCNSVSNLKASVVFGLAAAYLLYLL